MIRLMVWVFALWLVAAAALAHKASDSYLSLETTAAGITGRWDIALRDLDEAVGLDGDDDGTITWGELRRRAAAIQSYALARLKLESGNRPCPLEPGKIRVDHHSDGTYAVLGFAAHCAAGPERLTVEYRLLFDLDPQHRGLLRLTADGTTQTAVFAPMAARQVFEPASTPWRGFVQYVAEGVWHIWTGYDHILFLLSLLLPAVLVREAGAWRPAPRFRDALWDAVRIVTAFTLAHSLTLSLAALGYLALPSRWVEAAIAASVVAAALNNIFPLLHGRRTRLAFLFGWVHGLGFASVLLDLGLPPAVRLVGLAGFNLGVEAGQLVLVAGFLPLAYGLSRSPWYPPAVLRWGSAAIALLAGVWLVERGFDLKLLSFPS
ncbi:HupE / UreJ protein [Methylomagnum ishizawai]|uniref:HupE / UreJ protein n=1 Tax=Methylomagnum ishizawai TaxID=1760988 RepID=A0A1Y6DAE3_9GAMM|nr:HupE/UreJ family protein [Methylomagnum ishizawai]SMF97312.1 HupE / UreJ protein [Methylomagnum ishizawai]